MKDTLQLSLKAVMCNYSVHCAQCVVKQTQLLFRVLDVDKHLQAFQSDTGRMKIGMCFFFFFFCLYVCVVL